MRRIDTDYSNRLPDDFVAIVLTKEDLKIIIEVLDLTLETTPTGLLSQFKKLMEGDKWSES